MRLRHPRQTPELTRARKAPSATRGLARGGLGTCQINSVGWFLGGHFGPEKKYLAPNSPQTPSRPLGPSPSWTPPPGVFNKKLNLPPPAGGSLGLSFPAPRAEKNKPYPNRPSRFYVKQATEIKIKKFGRFSRRMTTTLQR